MPDPGSHKYDVKRARRRAEYENREGVPDQRADRAANEDLQQVHPPRRPADDRAAGPLGERPSGEPGGQGRERDREGGGIRVRSSAFNDHGPLPRRCSREGGNIPPALEWEGVPDGTAEIAVVCEDPDAPGGTFLHWLVTGIDPQVTAIGDREMPEGAVESRNDFGEYGWGGPMPPAGDPPHRYFFHVHASSRPLHLFPDSTVDDLRDRLAESELAHGNIVGRYQR
ncbi:YbhB/YbcL family Raf kinase inhibitor-like protein [Saccharopolyspora rosea]|uniref:YbhB/YbcL family Raf kinase inhibitor-like protein n=1 Tax=Saccharopolyspora rosea TaxID=524884 RepID=A0ABW3FZN9_9PSEU|nr:YbhB/YbcL family Raf kinase inhibitor-like protein [Saccharopolyspora rosea]